MSVLEAELSLEPLSPEQPCGSNLQYDADFIELERVAQGKPEQQYGETIIPAEGPEWKEVKRLALTLQHRTKDLRIACHLARAAAEIDGLAGFCKCMSLTRGYVEQYWDGVHPQLDPEDDNDPTERVNILASLADKLSTVAQLYQAPMVRSMIGVFSMRDVLVARGEVPAIGDRGAVEMSTIDAAFMDCDLDNLRGLIETLEQGRADVVAIEDFVTQQVGTSNAVSMEALSDALKSIHDYLVRQLRMRESNQSSDAVDDFESAGAEAANGGLARVAGSGQGISGEIRSREDVMRTLDKICDYYERYEPSSPLPMLLKRAKRLATKSFLDILEDLTPEGLSQARMIGGVDQGQGED
jgi:type VI secretion system protein ImpA